MQARRLLDEHVISYKPELNLVRSDCIDPVILTWVGLNWTLGCLKSRALTA